MVSALPGAAQNVMAQDPGAITQIMQSLGYTAELGKDNGGDPRISLSSDGVKFFVNFYGCTDGKNCNAISLIAAFDLNAGSSVTLMNAWTRKKRYTKAYLDEEQDPIVDMDLYLGDDGISIDNFLFSVNVWDRALREFKTYIKQ